VLLYRVYFSSESIFVAAFLATLYTPDLNAGSVLLMPESSLENDSLRNSCLI
jgi:hypothetical protein